MTDDNRSQKFRLEAHTKGFRLVEYLCDLADAMLPTPRLCFPDKPMRTTFIHRLAVYASLAFVASLALSVIVETGHCRREVQRAIEAKIDEAYNRSHNARNAFIILSEGPKRQAQASAKAIAYALRQEPEILTNPLDGERSLKEMASVFRVDELDVADENGVIIACWPETSLGFNYHHSDQAKEFLEILKDPSKVITQPIRESEGSDNGKYQYTAVARLDAPGFIEVGYNAGDLYRWYEMADISKYVDVNIGKAGFLVIFLDNRQIAGRTVPLELVSLPTDKLTTVTIDDQFYFALARKVDKGLTLLGAVPQREVYLTRRGRFALLVFANFFIFFAIFSVVSMLVQRLFVDSVREINCSLDRITNGDLDEKVCVNATREFTDLSNGVNATVDSLKSAAAEVERKTQEELALARRIQTASVPDLASLYPDGRVFDVCAEFRAKNGVGGDVYDFFYVDEETILFYVADVAGSGVPAALISMKFMALVKNLAHSGCTLDQIVTRTNRYLTDGGEINLICAFFCMMDLKTGHVQYVNAGHISPIIREKGRNFEIYHSEKCLMLGSDPDTEYVSSAFDLHPGDVLALFTDGFKEELRLRTDQTDAIKEYLALYNSLPEDTCAKDCVKFVFDTVRRITNSDVPADDETILIFRLKEYA